MEQAWPLEARELQTFCKFEKFILSDRHEIHINYVMIEWLLVCKALGLFDNTCQISMEIIVPTS